ncbi:NADPH-dependent FMN reductase [Sphingobium fluviale]|uniref:NAD(P)H-dependent oxidoreductase n=1 Tax=Sphingobium fluviale TaxID=2506423 RepID=A0A4Q1KJK8_9SPHN|nr:NADPH-dependent FMN reductase [Sphingobium fluviale]RXR30013.1 NAD(P)H-dependent oxidoreductase [Sphingobium fluviale]
MKVEVAEGRGRDELVLRFAGLPGSLRRASFNSALLREAAVLAPPQAQLALYDDLAQLPHYNKDLREEGDPAPVADMRAFFAEADAAVIACPEYNRGMPGVLKNALDWLSRPPDPPLYGKSVLLIGTATGGMGGALAHYQARQVLSAMGAIVLPGREVVLPFAADRFTPELRLRQESDRILLREAMERFCALKVFSLGN